MKTSRILVLEEEILIAENVRICLRDVGYEVKISFSVSDALDKISEFNPQLVIIGTVAKEAHDELEAAVLIESSVSYPLEFIFLLSRPISVVNSVKSYQVLQKPFADEELLKIVKEQFQN